MSPCPLRPQGRELGDSPCPEHISGKALRTGPQGALGTGITWLRVLTDLGRKFCFLNLDSLVEKVGWLILGSVCLSAEGKATAAWAAQASGKA